MIHHVEQTVLMHWSKWNGMLSDVPFWSPHGAYSSLIVLSAFAVLLGRYLWLTALKG